MPVQQDGGAIRGLGWVYLGVVDAMRQLIPTRQSSVIASCVPALSEEGAPQLGQLALCGDERLHACRQGRQSCNAVPSSETPWWWFEKARRCCGGAEILGKSRSAKTANSASLRPAPRKPIAEPITTRRVCPFALLPSCCETSLRMATLRSTGVHKPTALQYLIQEGILGHDSTERDYVWHTYNDESAEGPTEELLTTEYHVVWSQAGVVCKAFNFEVEKEKVVQALLTFFVSEEPPHSALESAEGASQVSGNESSRSFLTQGTQPATDPNAPVDPVPPTAELCVRALVVFLKSQAHVFFLSGTTYIVNLPFEVDKAFPAARGVIVQRKIAPLRTIQPSPQIPSAPPNSFLANNQSFLSQTFSQTLSQPYLLHASSVNAPRLSRARQSGNVMFLNEALDPSLMLNSEAIPRLYSFTDPLSELGLVVNVIVGGERSSLLTSQGSGHRRLEAIDKAEEILYVSSQNEVTFDRSGNDKPLLLVITANHETNVFTVWSAAYLEPKSISASRKHHVPVPLSKSRRRSSHGTTGARYRSQQRAAVRGAERLRESFGGASRSKTLPASFKEASRSKERLSDQAVEDVLASQLNPDSEIARQPKESRRVSSLLSRAELTTSFDKSAFQDLATNRTSLGGSFPASFGANQRNRHSLGQDRTSFGGFSQSRHRASTPGSVTSRMSFRRGIDR